MTKYGIVEFDAWYKEYDPNFIDINIKSNMRNAWLSFQNVLSGDYANSIIKPINRYVEKLYPMPILISASDDEIILQQQNHAEIFLEINRDGKFFNVDKPHMRQYYQSKEDQPASEDCFDEKYKLYIPWVIDDNVLVEIEQPENSPFLIYPRTLEFKKIRKTLQYFEPDFVKFKFKKIGSHMSADGTYGKILVGSPMFNLRIKANKDIIRNIRKAYNG